MVVSESLQSRSLCLRSGKEDPEAGALPSPLRKDG